MYGDLVNLGTGAVDHWAATKFLLKCNSFHFAMNFSEFLRLTLSTFIFGFIIFHRNLISYELRKSSGKWGGDSDIPFARICIRCNF